MRTLAVWLVCALPAICAEAGPEIRSWVLAASAEGGVRSIAPDVHAVHADDDFVYVESAGLSLHSFGALEANQYEPPLGPRRLTFRIPRHPKPAAGMHASAPLGIVGVFATGVPIYNPIGVNSYRDQNIWHVDAVAASKAGATPLLTSLTASASRHSPIIGFALDGYPIYGPFGRDGAGNVKRMTSSYRLRVIERRDTLPDGTALTPGQEGPDPGPDFPLGTFAEDYEFVNGSGDLDEYNGRFTHTPDYPAGTYAYFLTTWPYMVGPRYHGAAPFAAAPVAGSDVANLRLDGSTITLAFRDPRGNPIRFLERIHEKQIHLVLVSKDLSEFAHIHPEPVPGDVFSVHHTFAHGGEYTLYADYTAPGAAPAIAKFDITVPGEPRKPDPLRETETTEMTKTAGGVRIALHAPPVLKAGEDLPLDFNLNVADLEPYLGAWAHIMIVSGDREIFIHAHPLENVNSDSNPLAHVHTAPVAGPSPSTIRAVTGFSHPGIYKLWFQFQRNGEVSTVSWVVKVAPADAVEPPGAGAAPASAVRIGSAGFEPPRLIVPANRKTTVAFTRVDAQNCAREIVFPELGIRRQLPAGQTVLIELPPLPKGELHFACGMGMYKGALLVVPGT